MSNNCLQAKSLPFFLFLLIKNNRPKSDFPNSQSVKCIKVHVYSPYRGAILFYVYIIPLGLIITFLYVGRVQISVGSAKTIFFKFPYKTIIAKLKKVKFQSHLYRKNHYVIGKVIKNYIQCKTL